MPADLTVKPLHPTFAAELSGVDFTKAVAPDVVVVVRDPKLTGEAHVELSKYFGDLDDVTPYMQAGCKHRVPFKELFNAENIDPETNDVAAMNNVTLVGNLANELSHVDSSFNARRAGFSLLFANTLPPEGTGGSTEYKYPPVSWTHQVLGCTVGYFGDWPAEL